MVPPGAFYPEGQSLRGAFYLAGQSLRLSFPITKLHVICDKESRFGLDGCGYWRSFIFLILPKSVTQTCEIT